MNMAFFCLAMLQMAVGAHGRPSNEVRQLHATFPLRGHGGDDLEPSLLEGVDVFTSDLVSHIRSSVAQHDEQWEEVFFKHNVVSNGTAFCFSLVNGTDAAAVDGDEEIMAEAAGVLADNTTVSAAAKGGLAVGHWCCRGHAPKWTQLAMANCFRTNTNQSGALEQAQGQRLGQGTVDAHGSITMRSAGDRSHTSLMRSVQEHPTGVGARGGAEADDPRIYPTSIFLASLRDGVGSGSLDLAVEQVAHLARATSGLVVVDKRMFSSLMKALGSHPARFRVVAGDGWFFWLLMFIAIKVFAGLCPRCNAARNVGVFG